jgi:hypothetical protein
MPCALITGITGQDGSLCEPSCPRGEVTASSPWRWRIVPPMWRIKHLLKDVRLHAGSLESFLSIY